MKAKRFIKIFLLIIFIVLGIIQSNAQNTKGQGFCNAFFTFYIMESYSPLTYSFKNESTTSSTITKYEWNFGDGETSKLKNPEHQFIQQGDYVVSLTITNLEGNISTFSDTIKINLIIPPSCSAYFTYLRLTASPDYTFKFTDHSIHTGDTINQWKWTFGDGSSAVFAQNPIHQFMNSGNYNVKLEINTNGGCASYYQTTVQILSTPNPCDASFTYNKDTLVSTGLKYFFHDNSTSSEQIVKWLWKFGDGDSSNLQDPTHTFPYQGIYNVKLTIKTISNNTSEIIIPIQVGNPKNYNLWGRVYAGNYVIDKCIAYIYREYNNSYIEPFDTVKLTSINDTLGVYYFFQIPEGKYRVKVMGSSNSIYAKEYAPTYYGDNKFWKPASTIPLFTNVSVANIQLEKVIPNTGNGQVTGKIYNQSNLLFSINEIEILLLNSSNQVVDYTFTDNSGNFVFSDVGQGTYHVYAELAGFDCNPAVINCNTINDSISNVNIIIKNALISGFVDNHQKLLTEIYVYPNPAEDELLFSADLKGSSCIEIIDITGRRMLIRNEYIEKNQVVVCDISNLASGVYFVKLSMKDTPNFSIKKFIKK